MRFRLSIDFAEPNLLRVSYCSLFTMNEPRQKILQSSERPCLRVMFAGIAEL